MGFTPKEFPNFWPLPLKNSTTFIPYPWRIPLFLNRGGGADIKWNSPLKDLLRLKNIKHNLTREGLYLISRPNLIKQSCSTKFT